MRRRLALVGAVGSEGMEKHVRLLEAGCLHWDGWTHKNVLTVRAQLTRQLREDGSFVLLAYASKAGGGDGRIRWVVEVDDARFYDLKQPFEDEAHGDCYDVYSELHYAKVRRVCMELADLESWDGTPVRAQRLRNTFVLVVDPGPG